MRVADTRIFIPLVVALGCSRPTRTNPVPELPVPVTPSPAPRVQAPQSWNFSYQAGIASYRILRNATIVSLTDSLPSTTIDSSTNATHEMLSLERIGDTIHFALAVDTFATTIPERAGIQQPIDLPVQINGWMTRDSLVVALDSVNVRCSPIASTAVADLQNLLVRFPAQLTPGMTWQDSVELNGCQAAIPSVIHATRFFRVAGQSPAEEAGVVVIERRDSVSAHGEGAQQQHHIILDAIGNGTAVYYLSTSDGLLLRTTSEQSLDITITTSEKAGRFRQTLKQELTLIR